MIQLSRNYISRASCSPRKIRMDLHRLIERRDFEEEKNLRMKNADLSLYVLELRGVRITKDESLQCESTRITSRERKIRPTAAASFTR